MSVLEPPVKVGVAPTTEPLEPATVRLCPSGALLAKLIVTVPALALSVVLENLSWPDGSALTASGPLPPVAALAVEVAGALELLLADGVELELELEPPQAPRPMATAAVAKMSAGSFDTDRFSFGFGLGSGSMMLGRETRRAQRRAPASLTMRDPATGPMLPVAVAASEVGPIAGPLDARQDVDTGVAQQASKAR